MEETLYVSTSVEGIADWNRKQHGIYGAVSLLFKTPRFVFDGTTRIPNFLNAISENDKRLQREPSLGTGDCTLRDAEILVDPESAENVSPDAPAASPAALNAEPMTRQLAHMATSRALLGNDPRFLSLTEPFAEDAGIGPGAYPAADTHARPGVGTLTPDHALASASVARDPLRQSQAFLVKERPGSALWERPPAGPAVLLLAREDPSYVPGPGRWAPWHTSSDRRAPPIDWRYSTHHRDDKRGLEGSYEVADVGLAPLDKAGAPVELGRQANGVRNTAKAAFAPTQQPRLAMLPVERHNDVRVRSLTSLMEPARANSLPCAHPHRHIPLQSLGGAKRRTYRIFEPPPPRGSSTGKATVILPVATARARTTRRDDGDEEESGRFRQPRLRVNESMLNPYYPQTTAAAAASTATVNMGFSSGVAGGVGGLRGRSQVYPAATANSSSFATTYRSGDKYGPFTWATDSRMVRH